MCAYGSDDQTWKECSKKEERRKNTEGKRGGVGRMVSWFQTKVQVSTQINGIPWPSMVVTSHYHLTTAWACMVHRHGVLNYRRTEAYKVMTIGKLAFFLIPSVDLLDKYSPDDDVCRIPSCSRSFLSYRRNSCKISTSRSGTSAVRGS